MPTSRGPLAFLLAALLMTGCAATRNSDAGANEAAIGEDVGAAAIAEGSIEADGVLLLVNDRGTTTVDILRQRAGLEAGVAQSIVGFRTNADGTPRWFASLAELDAIPGTTAAVFKQLVADATANGYVDVPGFDPPTLAQIVTPEYGGPLTIDTVQVDAGFDGLSPSDMLAIVRGRVPSVIHPDNEQFLRKTILATHKSFTLGIGNLFVQNAPFAGWLRGLEADQITLLGTISAIHPTVLLTEKDGVKSYWVRNAQGYEAIDWPTYHYPILMRAHIRLETDPAGQGVRVFYPACPLKVLSQPIHIDVEEPNDP